MFLTSKEYGLSDFLQALSFIPPNGMNVAYFISPKEMQVPEGSGFEYQMPATPEDESQTYSRTLPIQKIDQAATPGDYSVWEPGELGRRQPMPNILPQITEPEQLDSPFVKILSEGKMYGTDIKLLEDYGPFPKNTVFHCVLSKLDEGEKR